MGRKEYAISVCCAVRMSVQVGMAECIKSLPLSVCYYLITYMVYLAVCPGTCEAAQRLAGVKQGRDGGTFHI